MRIYSMRSLYWRSLFLALWMVMALAVFAIAQPASSAQFSAYSSASLIAE